MDTGYKPFWEAEELDVNGVLEFQRETPSEWLAPMPNETFVGNQDILGEMMALFDNSGPGRNRNRVPGPPNQVFDQEEYVEASSVAATEEIGMHCVEEMVDDSDSSSSSPESAFHSCSTSNSDVSTSGYDAGSETETDTSTSSGYYSGHYWLNGNSMKIFDRGNGLNASTAFPDALALVKVKDEPDVDMVEHGPDVEMMEEEPDVDMVLDPPPAAAAAKEQVDISKMRVVVKVGMDVLKSVLASGVDPAQIKVDRRLSRPVVPRKVKQHVPADQKNNDYWERRLRNNSAAKRCRDARRVKENEMMLRAIYLEDRYVTLQREYREALDAKAKRDANRLGGQSINPTSGSGSAVPQHAGERKRVQAQEEAQTQARHRPDIYVLGPDTKIFKMEVP